VATTPPTEPPAPPPTVSPRRAFAADTFISPNTCYIEIGATGSEVEFPVKDAQLKRSCKRPSVRNHKTRGMPLSVQGGYDGTCTFKMPVAPGVYVLQLNEVYPIIFAFDDTNSYTVDIAITDITDSIPDQDGEEAPMWDISAILEGDIVELGIL